MPAMILTSVDLPAPFSPTSAWIEPGRTGVPPSYEQTFFPRADLMRFRRPTRFFDDDVYDDDIPHLAVGHEVKLTIAGIADPITSKVSFVAPTIDESTRTLFCGDLFTQPGADSPASFWDAMGPRDAKDAKEEKGSTACDGSCLIVVCWASLASLGPLASL